jgi:hypothetical protein
MLMSAIVITRPVRHQTYLAMLSVTDNENDTKTATVVFVFPTAI